MKTVSNPAVGTAHGKIILMGEHSVVYGEPAIAVPFPSVSVVATLTEKSGSITIESDYFTGELDQAPHSLDNLKAAVQVTCEALGQFASGFHMHIQSTIPPERGMGSSAAVAAAVIRSLYAHFHRDLDREQLLRLVNVSETIAHGNPSGLDAWMTSGEIPVYFQKEKPFEPLPLQMNAYLVVADTGQKGQTKDTVRDVSRLEQLYSEEARRIIRRLGALAEQAKVAIQEKNPVQLGECMKKAHSQLMTLTVSNAHLDRLVAAALYAGALGAKLTGGGRGGCMIALAADRMAAEKIAAALEHAGAEQTWIHSLGGD
ncbi:mevalonate kinase [Atopococcus tabaci]|uniref:mevalonate kinase n=1 Tax=Atopococcus tabaci TaxID=269774 RepID=UPI00040B344B|nr:mevalonate kinase [Atopococcus tabaci]